MSRLLILSLALTTLWANVSLAQDSYPQRPQTLAVIDELVEQEGFNKEQLVALFAKVEFKQSIIDAMSRPAEKTKPWYDYRKIFVTDQRAREGLAFYATHKETFDRAERDTGVPAEVILSIIGVETYYGRITGSYRVIDALSTLAFDYPKRSVFFTSELKHFLILARDQGVDPLSLKGSYAGAMGYGQFMPSSYRAYAVDFDGDDHIDIWNNPVDAIGSVANYFVQHGWKSGESVVVPAQVTQEVSDEIFNKGLKPSKTLAEYAQMGIRGAQKQLPPLDPNSMVTAIQFETQEGNKHWLGLHNFYVITRYNHSAMYAMSVHQLSQDLAAQVAQAAK
ncbi:MAG: membrane-bound lytic murein transglycosylase B [Halioglobus sp.]|jgi:membrane-bound lytic murein transglycosylase B